MSEIFSFLFNPIVWIPIVAILAYLTRQNYKKIDQLQTLNTDAVLLNLQSKKEFVRVAKATYALAE